MKMGVNAYARRCGNIGMLYTVNKYISEYICEAYEQTIMISASDTFVKCHGTLVLKLYC